jgi:predicted kinase
LYREEIIFMCGLPGCGKSTHIDICYDYTPYQILCKDDVRYSFGTEFHGGVEPVVDSTIKTMCQAYMIRGLPILVDETNTRYAALKPYLQLAKVYNYTTHLIILDTPVETCMERRCEDTSNPWKQIIERKVVQFMDFMFDIYFNRDSIKIDRITKYKYDNEGELLTVAKL